MQISSGKLPHPCTAWCQNRLQHAHPHALLLLQVAWEFSAAGPHCVSMRPYGEWMASKLPRHIWPAARPGWDSQWGDRKQELVLIGQGLQHGALEAALEQCLLTEAEMAAGEEAWEGWECGLWRRMLPD